ncbi:MAG: hypothetical protein O2887_10145 [Bacteroidetes bacterium]|nr:hypothetical protein [Bacteroidota bacterium]MDA1120830.1 hypothetical protein [Bacteroidota bacterium]
MIFFLWIGDTITNYSRANFIMEQELSFPLVTIGMIFSLGSVFNG